MLEIQPVVFPSIIFAVSPTNGGNVYTKTNDSDMHFFRSILGDWYIGDTANMIAGQSIGWIGSVSTSHSPLDLEWKFVSGGSFPLDPLLKVTGL